SSAVSVTRYFFAMSASCRANNKTTRVRMTDLTRQSKTDRPLGALLSNVGERDAARKELEAARDLQKKLVAQHPAFPAYKPDLAKAPYTLGVVLRDGASGDTAPQEFEAARALQKKLDAQYPAVPAYQQELARTHGNLGILLTGLDQRDAARKEHETAR